MSKTMTAAGTLAVFCTLSFAGAGAGWAQSGQTSPRGKGQPGMQGSNGQPGTPGGSQQMHGGGQGSAPGAGSSPSDMPSAIREEMTTAPFTVDAIDKSNRMLTLRSPDGERVTINVPPEVTGFDRLKKGDQIEVDYYRSMAVSVMPPGSPVPGTQERSGAQRTSTGGMRGRQVTMSAEVVSVDRSNNTVQLKGKNGKTQTVAVQDPDMQRRLAGLKPGSVVQVTFTEAVAAAIRQPGQR